MSAMIVKSNLSRFASGYKTKAKKDCGNLFVKNFESRNFSSNCNFKPTMTKNFIKSNFESKNTCIKNNNNFYQSNLFNFRGIKRRFCTNNNGDQKLQYVNEHVLTDNESQEITKKKEVKELIAIFTCQVCSTRKDYRFGKHSYEKGIVIVRCPGCNKLHLVADNLGWFRDEKVNIEDLAREAGETPLVLGGTAARALLQTIGANPDDPSPEDSEKLIKNIIVHDHTKDDEKDKNGDGNDNNKI